MAQEVDAGIILDFQTGRQPERVTRGPGTTTEWTFRSAAARNTQLQLGVQRPAG